MTVLRQGSIVTEETSFMQSETSYPLLPQFPRQNIEEIWICGVNITRNTVIHFRTAVNLRKSLIVMLEEGKLNLFLNRDSARKRYNSDSREYKKTETEKLASLHSKNTSSATDGVINMIVGGYSEEFPTIRSARDSIHTLVKGPPKEQPSCPEMKFNEELSVPLQQPHSDPVVVTLKIGQMKVCRFLVDTGSTIDLITMECLRQMKYEEKHLQPMDMPLIWFGGGIVIPLGTIVHPVRIGKKNNGRSRDGNGSDSAYYQDLFLSILHL